MIVRSSDGASIFFECFRARNARGALLVIHGLGEHCGRYDEVVEEARRLRLDVHLIDLRGHGRSSGTRGHFTSFEEIHQDIDAWLKHLVEAGELKASLPCFLLGHSFGGLVALTFAARYVPGPLYPHFTGLILSSPLMGVKWNPARALEAQIARRTPKFLQSLQIPTGIKFTDLTHDKAEVARCQADPLMHQWITPGGFNAMERAMASLPKLVAQLNLPMLFLVSGQDKIVNPLSTLGFAKKCSVAHPGKVEVRVFHNFYHEPFHELKKDRAFLELKKWILRCLPRNTTPISSSSSKSSVSAATGKAISRSPRARRAPST
jgi:alpha-beta hydrolase superfamily lysophospholipase